jgi:hypothetical protein
MKIKQGQFVRNLLSSKIVRVEKIHFCEVVKENVIEFKEYIEEEKTATAVPYLTKFLGEHHFTSKLN